MPTPEVAPAETPFIPKAFIPPPVDPPPWRLAARTLANQIEGWPRAMFEADSYRPPFPGAPLFIMQPEAIRTVLLDSAEDFPQGDLFKRMMRPAWGNGLLTADKRDWRLQRRAAAPRPQRWIGLLQDMRAHRVLSTLCHLTREMGSVVLVRGDRGCRFLTHLSLPLSSRLCGGCHSARSKRTPRSCGQAARG